MSTGINCTDEQFEQITKLPFGQLPADLLIRAFGMDYAHIQCDNGDLFITKYGWPWVKQLMPSHWYHDRHYRQQGEKLSGSTGTVYRVPTKPVNGKSIDLVMKFSRVGQEVPLVITAKNFGEDYSPNEVANARFNSPMEEFGLLEELRQGAFGPKEIVLRNQRPLAIYTPHQQLALWKLGRTQSRFRSHQMLLAVDQENASKAIELDIKRDYISLFSWVNGRDAEQAFEAGLISKKQLHKMTYRVLDELRNKGFRVLDTKPKHFIVRERKKNKQLLQHNNKISYALVDFELLGRTIEYQRQYNATRRAQYWQIQSQKLHAPLQPLPPHLKRVKIFGVDYIYGNAPNGGKIWAVGTDPDLFDYFLPDRWRRTPRLKLSVSNEVYRTRTRDNIHVVYRQSRVGLRPHGDPFYEHDKRIREHGYNSPFEEIGIAHLLQRAGVRTAYPRAIYRTGHQSSKAGYLRDERRSKSHRDLLTPEGEPILSPHHDYYTIWGYWRGIDPLRHFRQSGNWGFVDLEKALEDRHITRSEYLHLIKNSRQRLNQIGFEGDVVEPHELLLTFDVDGRLHTDANNELGITLSMDALTAFEFGLQSEQSYREIIRRLKARLALVGCEALDLSGNHLLLSMNPDGQLKTDPQNRLDVTLGNLELVRVLISRLSYTNGQ